MNLIPFLTGEKEGRPHETLFWRIDGMWAIRHGDLKLVSGEPGHAAELFDLATDIGESNDLATKQAEKVGELKALWDGWNKQLASPSKPKEKSTKNDKKKEKKNGGN